MTPTFNIKAGYTPNLTQQTFDEEGGNYWNEQRVSDSRLFQFHVYEMCRNLIATRGYTSFMDVGCGPATKVESLIQSVCNDITLIDQPSSADMIAQRVPSAKFIGLNLEQFDLNLGHQVDLIVCADVIEHLIDPRPCVEFIRRHLADGGLAILSTPERDIVRGSSCTSCPKPEHVREWNSEEFKEFLTDSGFTMERQEWFPEKKTRKLPFLAGRAISNVWKHRAWAGCQVAICANSDEGLKSPAASNRKAA